MKYFSFFNRFYAPPVMGWGWGFLLVVLFAFFSCKDDDGLELAGQYGYAQFNVVKAETRAASTDTRATSTQLESLNDAAKVRVVLSHEGTAITQTLVLKRYSAESAEFGLQSEKLRLLAGTYTITGFYLYNALDEEIYANSAGSDATFEVVPDGLHYHTLEVDAIIRGMATFRLTKKFVKTRAGDEPAYPFSNIRGVSFTVKNLFTNEMRNIEKVPVTVKSDIETDEKGNKIQTTYGECDTLVWLPTGTYQVTGYTTFSDKKCRYMLETATVKNAPTFVIAANEKTADARVPILLSESSERMKDYEALKVIWEAMDGPNWRYHGEASTPGSNWNFDKDRDLWGEQPGISLDEDGRVSVLNLIGMGAKGVVPDAIGQLTQLRVLYLGAHDEALGGMIGSDISAYDQPETLARIRASYENLFLRSDTRSAFSEPMQQFINQDPKQRPILKSRLDLKDVQQGYLTNDIQGISRAVKRCKQLQQFYIANSPITAEGFFRDVDPESPFYGDPTEWEDFDALTDIEIYNCPKLIALPMEMIAHLPELQVLNVASNIGLSGEQLLKDWEALIEGTCCDKLQVLYMGYNNLEETPAHEQLKRMKSLSALDLSHNKLTFCAPFGKEINLVKLYLNNNRLTHINAAPDGYFSDFLDVEIMNFAFNQLTEVPDIFNAKSVYTIDEVNLSHNNITSLQHGSAFRGINAGTLDLSYNHFETMPKEIIASGSPIRYLIMSGNGMKEIPEGSLTGPKSSYIVSLDFSLNKLDKLPEDFLATNMPYLYGLDLSGNAFDCIPVQPLDCAQLTVLILRNQRDDEGNRTMKYWLTGLYNHQGLKALYLGGNDLRKIEDTISPNIYVFEIKDNPNISIDMSAICPYITAGYYQLFYDKTQDIRGCPALGIEN